MLDGDGQRVVFLDRGSMFRFRQGRQVSLAIGPTLFRSGSYLVFHYGNTFVRFQRVFQLRLRSGRTGFEDHGRSHGIGA